MSSHLNDEERAVKAQLEQLADAVIGLLESRATPEAPRYWRYFAMRATTLALGRLFRDALIDDPERAPELCVANLRSLSDFVANMDAINPFTAAPVGPVQ